MPDDEELNSLSKETLFWFSTQIRKDEEEDFKQRLAFAEYLAGFIDPEMFAQVKRAKRDSKVIPAEDFDNILKGISGRDAPSFKE